MEMRTIFSKIRKIKSKQQICSNLDFFNGEKWLVNMLTFDGIKEFHFVITFYRCFLKIGRVEIWNLSSSPHLFGTIYAFAVVVNPSKKAGAIVCVNSR